MTPDGLLDLGRRNLAAIAVVYLVLAGIVVTVPALIVSSSHPRDESPHPTHETNRR